MGNLKGIWKGVIGMTLFASFLHGIAFVLTVMSGVDVPLYRWVIQPIIYFIAFFLGTLLSGLFK